LTVRCRHDDGAEYIPTDDARVRVAPSSYASTTSLLVARKTMETVPHQHRRLERARMRLATAADGLTPLRFRALRHTDRRRLGRSN
jgi:hypothetical protein